MVNIFLPIDKHVIQLKDKARTHTRTHARAHTHTHTTYRLWKLTNAESVLQHNIDVLEATEKE